MVTEEYDGCNGRDFHGRELWCGGGDDAVIN